MQPLPPVAVSAAPAPKDDWAFPDEAFDFAKPSVGGTGGAHPPSQHAPVDAAEHTDAAARASGHDGHAAHPNGAFDHLVQPSWAEFRAGWDVYQAPVFCGVLAGAVLGLLSVFVVLRRAVFVTATISQAAGLGVALSFFAAIHWALPVPPMIGALVLSLLATGALVGRSSTRRLPREAVLGFAYLAASAGAVLIGDRITQEAHDISAILFGSAVLVSAVDLSLVGIVGMLVTASILVLYRGLVFVGFDPESARVQGLPVRALEAALWLLLALEVSVTTRAIGALPVFAFAVVPGMTALMLGAGLSWALLSAALLGALAGGLGYLSAFFLEFPVGACQAALAVLLFAGLGGGRKLANSLRGTSP